MRKRSHMLTIAAAVLSVLSPVVAVGATGPSRHRAALNDTMFPEISVAPKAGIRAYPFNLKDVRLLEARSGRPWSVTSNI